MVDEDSPILDFYPETFEIDMNGKKMAWQGVALLPFIDPKRLLDAMATRYPELNEDEVRRNRWGNNVILTADADPLYDYFCGLYTKKRSMQVRIMLFPVYMIRLISTVVVFSLLQSTQTLAEGCQDQCLQIHHVCPVRRIFRHLLLGT